MKGWGFVLDKTRVFSLTDNEEGIKASLTIVYDALKEKGYNPVNQIVGYIVSEDPTYITTYKNARNIIRKIDRDDLLETLVKYSGNDEVVREAKDLLERLSRQNFRNTAEDAYTG